MFDEGDTMFNESNLEQAIIELMVSKNFEYIHGNNVHKELSEVILLEDFREYLLRNYSDQQLDNDEIATITNKILAQEYSRQLIYIILIQPN